MIACAGTKTCSFAVIPNKEDAIKMAHYLKSAVGIENGMVRMNCLGFLKALESMGLADIGFEGCKAKDSEGNRVAWSSPLFGWKDIPQEAREA